ncbi:MAG: hypothetical protein Q7J03_07505 [Methanoregula sp.]|nr:hypothetical protein [Methanoregula sp.]
MLLLIVLVQGVFAEESCTFIRMWGSNTTAYGVAVDSSDNVYVTDTGHNRVSEYSSAGSIITFWDLRESEYRQAEVPYGIAVDSAQNVYVTDRKNNTVMKFSTRGNQGEWGSEGSGDGQFSHPMGIAVDSSGMVYVADTGNNRIQKIHSTGMYLLQWGSYGFADGAFNAPTGVTVDSSGNVYVADTGNKRIQKFTSTGTFLAKWGTAGTGDGQFSTPTGLTTDPWGNVYVADLTSRVQKFSPTGEYFSSCNTGGTTYDVAVDPSGTLYALWQSGSVWKIGKYTTPSSIPTQNPPQQSHTISIAIGQTKTIPAVPTTSPTAAPVTLISPVTTPTPGYNATIAAPGDQNDGEVKKTDIKKEVFYRISGFFSYVFGREFNFFA